MNYNILQEIVRLNSNVEESKQVLLNPFCIIGDKGKEIVANYFSCPICTEKDAKLLTLKYKQMGTRFCGGGSNAEIVYEQGFLSLQNQFCNVKINLQGSDVFAREVKTDFFGMERECITNEKYCIYLSLNGVAVQTKQEEIKFQFKGDFVVIDQNGQSVSFMANKFLPYLVISPLAERETDGKVKPLFCEIRAEGEQYKVCFNKENDSELLCSFDMYTGKSVFDTTVESKRPNMSNPFGAVAVLGESYECGRQWMYSRPNAELFSELRGMKVLKAELNLFCYTAPSEQISVYKMRDNWCSFGSTWSNRVLPAKLLSMAYKKENYLVADITEVVREIVERGFNDRVPGIAILSNSEKHGYEMLATGDNYYTPQIIQIKLKKKEI